MRKLFTTILTLACFVAAGATRSSAGGLVPGAAALDDASQQFHLYVGNVATNTVTIYDGNANGNVAPTRTIGGPNTGIVALEQVAVDARGYVYVANLNAVSAGPAIRRRGGDGAGSVLVFAPDANGNVVPIRTIAGPATRIDHATAVAVDSDGTLYVGSYQADKDGARESSTLLQFAAGATGNVSPRASLRYGTGNIDAITLDSDVGLIVSSGPGAPDGGDGPGTSVAYTTKNLSPEFGKIASYDPGPLAVDPATNTFVGLLSGPTDDWVYRFAIGTTGVLNSPDAGGVTPPVVSKFSVATCPMAIATDASGTIYVAGQGCPADSIDVYAPDSAGSALSLRQITGPATQLAAPTYITVGP